MQHCDCTEEMGSATPYGVEQLAACGGRGAYKGNMWRDLRSGARGSDKVALASIYVLSSIGMYSFKSIPTIMKKLTCTAIWGCGAHQYVKDLATLPIDFIALPLKDAANKEVMQKVPILPPHLLSNWLLQAGLLTFDQRATAQFWQHHIRQRTPWMEGYTLDSAMAFEPYALYGDKADYTVSKEKILIIFLSI